MKENSIEEDIEVIESIIEEYENCCVPEIDMQVNVTFREKQNNALNHILSDYKRVLKENERLQKENEELREDRDKFKKALGKRITYCNELEKDLFENCSNYVIPIQTIKDKIEKYKKMLLSCNRFSDVERILELEELLEGRK